MRERALQAQSREGPRGLKNQAMSKKTDTPEDIKFCKSAQQKHTVNRVTRQRPSLHTICTLTGSVNSVNIGETEATLGKHRPRLEEQAGSSVFLI